VWLLWFVRRFFDDVCLAWVICIAVFFGASSGGWYLSSAYFGRGKFLGLFSFYESCFGVIGLKCLVCSCFVLLRGLLFVFVMPGPISVSFHVSD
jgi:hypothetical protein